MKKRSIPAILLILAALLLGTVIPAAADTPLTYRDPVLDNTGSVTFDEAGNVKFTDAQITDYTLITSDMTTWGHSGTTLWYVAYENVTLDGRITIQGDARLILKDGVTLTANAGITCTGDGNSLTIYAQSDGENMGALYADGGGNDAGIGGENGTGSNITINGGEITANGGTNGSAGIGGGVGSDGTSITVNGGTVTATGGGLGAGIGGGFGGNGTSITVNGGAVTATGSGKGAGIGGGSVGSGSGIMVNGGTVTATSGGGAGIGGGAGRDGTNITISGGTVTANGGDKGAGIGGAGIGVGSGITVNGGTVIAIGGKSAAGIGSGSYRDGSNITISGGTVTATGGEGAAGIGSGGESGGSSTNITVTDSVRYITRHGDSAADTAVGPADRMNAFGNGTKRYFTIEAGAAVRTPADGAPVCYTSVYDAMANAQAGDRVTLLKDITEDRSLDVNAGTESSPVVLDLAGFTLTGSGSDAAIRVGASDTAYLILEDSSADVTGTITQAENSTACGVSVSNAGNLTMNGGVIRACSAEKGGGVYVGSGSFTMNGGVIRACSAEKGGGVYVDAGGSFTMNGGVIRACSAEKGGGVYVGSGSFTMTGGSITGCTASVNGGAVSMDGGTFVMTGGTVGACNAANGGGVYVDTGSLDMAGGTITGCSVSETGGGVYMTTGSTAYFSGSATVAGNQCGAAANNVFAETVYRTTVYQTGNLTGSIGIQNAVAYDPASGAVMGSLMPPAADYVGTDCFFMDGDPSYVGHRRQEAGHTDEIVLAKDCTVSFAMNGHGTAPASQTVWAGFKAVSPAPEPAETGYWFEGWFTDPDFENLWDFGQDTVSGNITLYARWSKLIAKPAARSGLTYDGTEKTGVAAGTGYTLSGTVTAVGAGTYQAAATLSNGYRWADGSADPIDISWKIAQAEVTLNWSGTELTYSGSPQAPTVQMSGFVSGDDVDIRVNGAQSAVGTYRGEYAATAVLTGTAAGNYRLPASGSSTEFTIDQKTIGIVWTGDSFTYDGQAHAPSAAPADGDLNAGEECGIAVTGAETDAGSHTAAATGLTGKNAGNYKLPETGLTKEFQIAPKTVGLTWTAPASLTYDGSAKVPGVIATGLAEGDNCRVTVALTEGRDNVNAGAFTFTATGLDNPNYALPADVTSGEYTITLGELTGDCFTWTAPAELEYDGSVKAGSAGVKEGITGAGALTVTYRQGGTEVDEPKNAGSYDVYVTAAEGANYAALTEPALIGSFTVAPRKAVLKWTDTELTYDGAEQKPAAEVDNLVPGDRCAVSVAGAETDAGTHTATAESLDNPNYRLPDVKPTQSYRIDPKKLTGAVLTLGGTGFTDGSVVRTGSSITPTLTLTDGSVTLAAGKDYTADPANSTLTAASVGTYTVTVTGTGNYSGTVRADWEITRTPVDVTAVLEFRSPDGLRYDGTGKAAVVTPKADGLGTVTLTYRQDGKEAVPVNAGTYQVYAAIAEGTEYQALEATLLGELVIAPRTVELEWTDVTQTYDGTDKKPAAGVANLIGSDEVEVTVTVEGDAVHAGSYTATADALSGRDAGNYALPDPKPVQTCTILKKPVAKPEPKDLTDVYDGEVRTIEIAENEDYTVSNNGQANAAVYTVSVNLNDPDNTEWADGTGEPVTAVLTINPRVTLQQGGNVLATAESSAPDGTFRFGEQEIAEGLYNLVAEFGDKTVTELVELEKNEAPEGRIEVPAQRVRAVVETAGTETPAIVADGLNEAAAGHAETGKTVEVRLVVEAVAAADVPDEQAEAIRGLPEAAGKNIVFLDIQIRKLLDGTAAGNITDTGSALLKIVVPFQTAGRTGFAVLRFHDANENGAVDDGEAAALTELKEGDTPAEGSYLVDLEKGQITIYAAKFSTYAIASRVVFAPAEHAVLLPETEHGTVSVSPEKAASGKEVTVTVTPDKGWTLETLTAKDANGKEIGLTDSGDGTWTFRMPDSKVALEACFMEDNSMLNFFTDVFAEDYYYDAVLWAVENGITTGTDETHFSPNAPTTRAQMVTFLWRAAGSPEPVSTACAFTDVVPGSFYEKAVLWGVENGIVRGCSETQFAPDEPVTRAQAVTFLARMNGVADADSGYTHGFTDVPSGTFYATAVAWAVENGITNGTGETTFSPEADCLRAQIVTFLYRCFGGR